MKERILVLLFFVLAVNVAIAQQALLKLKRGTSQEVYITDVDSLYLTTSKGVYELDRIDQVVFADKKGKDVALYYGLDDAGVKVVFDKSLELTHLKPPAIADEAKNFEYQFKKYRKAHQLGAGLQFAGVLLGVVSLLTDDDTYAYVGGVAAGAGLIIELNGGSKMRWED